jgi:TorA maturation chaperone TorD
MGPAGQMRDQGLSQAIAAAGGVSNLARRIGIAQPSVTGWIKIPAERVLSVEAATGVAREILRPDLYERPRMDAFIDETATARGQEYALLAALLGRAPNEDLLGRLARLQVNASPIGMAHAALAHAAAETDATRAGREFFDLFIGLGRGELLPYGSYYLTGFLHERPLARLRQDLDALGIARVEGNPEPEDHVAILCEIMAGLVTGAFGTPPDAERQMFEKHLKPWIGRFFADLEMAESARFYRAVGALGRVFIEIEIEAFALPA